MGAEQGLIKEVSEARKREDHIYIKEAFSTFFILTVLFSFSISLILFIWPKTISNLLFGSTDHYNLVRMVSFFLLTLGIGSSFTHFLSSFKKVKVLMYKSLIYGLITSFATIILIISFDIVGVLYALIFGGILNLFLGFFFLKRAKVLQFFQVKRLFSLFRSGVFIELTKYGSVLIISSITFQVVHVFIKSFIAERSGIEELGLYQAMSNITTQYLPVFVSSMSVYLLPHLTEQKSNQNFIIETNTSIRLILLIASAPLIFLVCFSDLIISILYTNDFVSGGPILDVLMINSIFGITNRLLVVCLISKKYLKEILIFDLITFGVILLFSYFLYDSFGLISISSAFLFGGLIHFMLMFWFLNRKSQFLFFPKNWSLLLMILFAMSFLFFSKPYMDLPMSSFWALVFSSSIYLFNLGKSEKKQILSIVGKLINR